MKSVLFTSLTNTVTAIVSLAMLLLATTTFAQESGLYVNEPPTGIGTDYVAGEVLVKFKNSQVPFERRKVPNVPAAIKALQKNPNVEFVEPNYIVAAFAAPNDPFYSPYQWHLDNPQYGGINLEAAWDLSTGAGVTVAVVDTGVDASLEDAPTCVTAGYNFVANNTDATDDNGHGSHVAGTIAQATNNGIGAAGVAYDACVMPVKVLGANGSGYTSDVALGVRYAADNGAKVINLSLGGGSYSQTMVDALAYAYNKGVTIVAASGNDSRGTVSYPAAYDEYVIAVGATSYDEEKASYSNYGSALDIVAPGGEMYVQRGPHTRTNDENNDGYSDGVLQNTIGSNGEGYYFFQGTSMASPHVAGVAALVLGYGNAATPEQVRAALQTTADDLGATGRDDSFGHGIVNAYEALLWNDVAVANQPPVASATADNTNVVVDEVVIFSGTGSVDPDGDTLSYDWEFGNGTVVTGSEVSYAYTATGTYTVTLTVSDGEFVDTDTVVITVSDTIVSVNNPPVAAFTVTTLDLTVDFDAGGSADPDGDALTYNWSFGDGSTGTGMTPSHTYATAGTYSATLTVSDGEFVSSTSEAVTVTEPVVADVNLSAVGYKDKGRQKVDLSWSGATTGTVEVFRDGVLIMTTANDGVETDHIDNRGGGAYEYQLCETAGGACSSLVTVVF